MNTFVENTIAAIRFQMKALDQALDMLEQQIKKPTEDADNGSPRCPSCGSKGISDMHVMGLKPQYACENCDFRGFLGAQ